ncbi:metallophosphoesterase [Streptomyces coffeae]|uniref:Metallophosphoesterase n=1 Tax=Streptomyces coffeae TaxID=621382 RepID=A0ABS1NK09_9ACTN|nr:metallophosphoesterase [Streptomyces coffeae]MBL1100305.1 metallophosphoesterase [Streptomyces coffeae]
MLVFAQISDVHVGQDRGDGGARAAERTRRVMAYLNGLPGQLDAILVTGDLADHGTEEEYREAAALLTSPRPVLTCPGNHDERTAYRRHFLGENTSGADATAPVNRAHHLPGATFLMCDSSVPGRHDGLLDDVTLAWLDRELADSPPDVPAFVAFHHPPLPLHIPYVDEIRQFQAERLEKVLDQYDHVVSLLCGHAHTAATTTFAGLPLLAAPGVVSTLTLPSECGDEDGPINFGLPPMVAFHVLDETNRVTTHFRAVPTDAG